MPSLPAASTVITRGGAARFLFFGRFETAFPREWLEQDITTKDELATELAVPMMPVRAVPSFPDELGDDLLT